jgi:hypothetical protein
MWRNVGSQVISAQLVSATDGSNVTTGTTTVYVTEDGGTQTAGAGTVTHEGQGTWSYVPTAGETDATHVSFTFTNASAITAMVQVYTQDQDTAIRLSEGAQVIAYGTVGNGTNNTTTVSISGGGGAISPAATVTDQFRGRTIYFKRATATTNLRGQGTLIDGNTTTAITIAAGDALTTAPANGDIFVIL